MARKKSKHVEVTAEDIDVAKGAERCNSRNCMIARALRRKKPDWLSITVDLMTIRYTDPKTRERRIYLTPPRAAGALVDFDEGVDLKPFSFMLPDHVAQVLPPRRPGQRARVSAKRATADAQGRTRITGGQAAPIAPLSSDSMAVKVGRIRQYGRQFLTRQADAERQGVAST
jgi:hypothetical protein